MSEQKNLPASRITSAEVQAFMDAENAQSMKAGMTRVEILPITREPSEESITFRWQQRHPRHSQIQPEMGWVAVGRGDQGQMVLLESSNDLDDDE